MSSAEQRLVCKLLCCPVLIRSTPPRRKVGIVTTVRSLEDRIPLRAKGSFGEMQNPSKKSNALLEETSLEVMSSNPGAKNFFLVKLESTNIMLLNLCIIEV